MQATARLIRVVRRHWLRIIWTFLLVLFFPLPQLPRYIYKPRIYNLIEEKGLKASQLLQECDLDYMNENRLQQDHPCVIAYIRKHYLRKPSGAKSLNLIHPEVSDPSGGQTEGILKIFNNLAGGFFVECGALDGEYLSNTLYMERYLNWSGILIEADANSFGSLLNKNRNSYAVPACLSLAPYPTTVSFRTNHALGRIEEENTSGEDIAIVQCFPLYSILLAVNKTAIDFFSLDVEGHEAKVLQTIPWHKVDIKVLTVEWEHIPEGKQALKKFMSELDYSVAADFHYMFAKDLAFVKNERK